MFVPSLANSVLPGRSLNWEATGQRTPLKCFPLPSSGICQGIGLNSALLEGAHCSHLATGRSTESEFFAAAAAAANSLQSCPTLCDPIDGSPPGSPIPGILQARTLEWVAISLSNAWKGKGKLVEVISGNVTDWSEIKINTILIALGTIPLSSRVYFSPPQFQHSAHTMTSVQSQSLLYWE